MLLLAVAALVGAQNVDPQPAPKAPSTYADLMAARVPVTTADITDRPYRVVGHVHRNVRKATVFSKSASLEKLKKELWERGRALNADAVVNARYGDARITVMSWGANKVEGDAIKFLTEQELAKPSASAAH